MGCQAQHSERNLNALSPGFLLIPRAIFLIRLCKNLPGTSQWTPASSLCIQLCIPHPVWLQLAKNCSRPVQTTSSNHICPVPAGTSPPWRAVLAPRKPSCRQTTLASFKFQWSSHTVPHFPLCNISMRPKPILFPFTRTETPVDRYKCSEFNLSNSPTWLSIGFEAPDFFNS